MSGGQKKVLDPLELELQTLRVARHECWETSSGPLTHPQGEKWHKRPKEGLNFEVIIIPYFLHSGKQQYFFHIDIVIENSSVIKIWKINSSSMCDISLSL